MAQFFIFFYATLTMFVLVSMQRNVREQRPHSQAITNVGWGLFSLSSTLAVLMGAVALAVACGVQMPLPAALNASLF